MLGFSGVVKLISVEMGVMIRKALLVNIKPVLGSSLPNSTDLSVKLCSLPLTISVANRLGKVLSPVFGEHPPS